MYDKFGEEEIKMNRIRNENDILLEIFVFYLTWGMLAYILTLGKSSANSRNGTMVTPLILIKVFTADSTRHPFSLPFGNTAQSAQRYNYTYPDGAHTSCDTNLQ